MTTAQKKAPLADLPSRQLWDGWVRRARKSGVSVTEIASRLGASMFSVWAWRKGVRTPDPTNRRAIERLTLGGVPADRWELPWQLKMIQGVRPVRLPDAPEPPESSR